MLNKRKITGDIRTKGTVEELLQSLFVALNMWEETLLNTEFNQDSVAIHEMVQEMVGFEIVIGVAGMTFPKLFKAMRFDLPEGVVAANMENPLYEPKAKDDQSEDRSSSATGGDNDDHSMDVPF